MALWNKNPAPVPSSISNADAERIYRESLVNTGPMYSRVTPGGSTYGTYEPDYVDPVESPVERRRLLGMRLRVAEGAKLPFDDLHTSLGKEKVFVFVMQNDQAVTLEDDRNMFPSDTLITQLRLIAK